jgi:hypothetical protein
MTAVTKSKRGAWTGAGTLALLLLAWAPAAGQEPAAREHVVQRGNTLWDLAQTYYNNPFHWPVIYEANRERVANPHWIYPDQRLVIPGLPTARTSPTPAMIGETVAMPAVTVVPARTRFFQEPLPEPGEIAVLELEAPLAVQPGEFYSAPWLGDPAGLQAIGRMLRVNNPDAERMREQQSSAKPYDEIYVTYAQQGWMPQVGERLLMVRQGRRLPLRQLGWVLEPTAIVTVSRLDRDVFVAQVTEQFLPVQRGDYAIPLERFALAPGVQARPVADGAEGVIVGFQDEQALYGTVERGFINLGSAHGLALGDELVAYMPPRPDQGYTLPPEPVARLKVVRVQDQTATVRITRARHGVLDVGMPVRVLAEMP